MTHLTDALVAQAIEQVIAKDSGWESNGCRVEGWSINIEPDAIFCREEIERLRLRLNTIERNCGGSSVLAYWRIHLYKGRFELRYLLSDSALEAECYPEGMLLPMYDDEDGDPVDGRLSFVAYMVGIAIGKLETDDKEAYDFACDFCDRDKYGHYLFNGQKTYEHILSYLRNRNNYDGEVILNRLVKNYRAYCKQKGYEYEKISKK